ncbi:hypothetical protein FORMB_13570 [Formosa sp. Hel1_33_131]|nr:hypothetical protein FORMB_13570 [Formosa sp. Hel1_33_131]
MTIFHLNNVSTHKAFPKPLKTPVLNFKYLSFSILDSIIFTN